MISHQPLVKIGAAVTNFALNLKLPVEGLIRATVLIIFAEVNVKDCLKVVDKAFSKGVLRLDWYSVEGEEEDHFDKALKMTLKQLVSLENISNSILRCLNPPV
jgi:proline dehydrogenase